MPLNETAESQILPERFFRLRVQDVRRETRDAVAITLETPSSLESRFAFTPGQYLTVRQEIVGQTIRRTYSICAAPQDKMLRIAIKRVPGGTFSNWANDYLQPGDWLEVMPPTGKFGLPVSPKNRRTYVAFAAGCGITPILSVVKSTLLAEPQSAFSLFYGNRASETVMFRNELADLKDQYLDRFNLVHVLTRERRESDLLNGRICGEKARQLLEHWVKDQPIDVAFLCGPGTFIRDVAEVLELRGLARSQIRQEFFNSGNGKTAKRPSAGPETRMCEVRVLLDGTEHKFTMPRGTESILHAGLRNGIDIRYGCQGGVCSSCRGHLTAGEVEMDSHYALEDYEVERGFILTCQSYPLTDQVTIDFDRVH
jgi:ring-1,2-phenylacetyl-CoA epoxidase subunit PaaE